MYTVWSYCSIGMICPKTTKSSDVLELFTEVPALRLGNQLSTQRVCIVAWKPIETSWNVLKPVGNLLKPVGNLLFVSQKNYFRFWDFIGFLLFFLFKARAHPGETCASWVMRGVWSLRVPWKSSKRDDIYRKMGPPLTYKMSDAFGFWWGLGFSSLWSRGRVD